MNPEEIIEPDDDAPMPEAEEEHSVPSPDGIETDKNAVESEALLLTPSIQVRAFCDSIQVRGDPAL